MKNQTNIFASTILTTILLVSAIASYGKQTNDSIKSRPLESLYLNIMGDASIISINFEKLFSLSDNLLLAGKIGLGYNEELKICVWGNCSPPNKYFTIPHHITLNYGRKKHFIELGLGGTLLVGETSEYYYLYPILGYRFFPLKSNKINFRVFGELPLTNWDNIGVIFIPFGISVGWSF